MWPVEYSLVQNSILSTLFMVHVSHGECVNYTMFTGSTLFKCTYIMKGVSWTVGLMPEKVHHMGSGLVLHDACRLYKSVAFHVVTM
jgi:hypothetical protein